MRDGAREVGRILDAATNRAAEALRVMEDAARFLLDDRPLTAEIKQLRHDLRAAAPIRRARDTPGDVGTSVSTSGELSRSTARDVIAAACGRLQEALRSLEEWTKLGPRDATVYESARYRAYTLEQRLLDAFPSPFVGWRLCLLLSESVCTRPWRDVARNAIDAGADCIQLREKDLSDRELLARARTLVELAAGRADIIINDRPDIALAAGAQGVHLGQTDLPLEDARALAADRLLIGVSTSNLDEAIAAQAADYCGVGPLFPSTTKAKPALSGPNYLRAYLAHKPQLPPALAISGITPRSIDELHAAAHNRPFGVAVSSYICAAEDPAGATRAILSPLSPGERGPG